MPGKLEDGSPFSSANPIPKEPIDQSMKEMLRNMREGKLPSGASMPEDTPRRIVPGEKNVTHFQKDETRRRTGIRGSGITFVGMSGKDRDDD